MRFLIIFCQFLSIINKLDQFFLKNNLIEARTNELILNSQKIKSQNRIDGSNRLSGI